MNQHQLSGASFVHMQGARSEACRQARKRRATKHMRKTGLPKREAQKWMIAVLLLLKVPKGTISSSRLAIVSFLSFST